MEEMVRKHLFNKINDNIDLAVTRSGMILETYSHVFPPMLVFEI